ncbi:hypothetical protein CEXT_297001 [Caerostris extrusa]|uniref:Uncharacterized protein n=1 Tax=Caerostris extrusa TaxID=172846 RepID=A0AAV4NVZ4_CAEEX|nr:hypothetical protein CEXT_297001 [Caerostris extrusa]
MDDTPLLLGGSCPAYQLPPSYWAEFPVKAAAHWRDGRKFDSQTNDQRLLLFYDSRTRRMSNGHPSSVHVTSTLLVSITQKFPLCMRRR